MLSPSVYMSSIITSDKERALAEKEFDAELWNEVKKDNPHIKREDDIVHIGLDPHKAKAKRKIAQKLNEHAREHRAKGDNTFGEHAYRLTWEDLKIIDNAMNRANLIVGKTISHQEFDKILDDIIDQYPEFAYAKVNQYKNPTNRIIV